jgi:hypothetical protein
LTDYHLPFRMTGNQVVIEIQTRLGFKPPTIMLASVSRLEINRIGSVANRIRVKPVDIERLVQEIESLLSARI